MIQLAHNKVMETIKTKLRRCWAKQDIKYIDAWQKPINRMENMGIPPLQVNGHLIPDGCCFFPEDRCIVIIEFARTSEYDGETGGAVVCLRK